MNPETARARDKENRLEEIHREAAMAAGKHVQQRSTAASSESYFGLPALKAPTWTWEVPLYFFFGGIAGVSASMAFIAKLFSYDSSLTRALLVCAFLGALICPVLLISDLGRPARFLNMLRVFKLQSPMSVGAWILIMFGGAATLALLAEELQSHGIIAPIISIVDWIAIAGGAVLGALLAAYTGVLVGATAIPVWSRHRTFLPAHFVTSGLGGTSAMMELVGFLIPVTQILGFVSSGIETLFGFLLEVRTKPADLPLRKGRSGITMRIGGLFEGPGALVIRLIWWHSVEGRYAAAACFLLGSLLSRYAWVWAGHVSATMVDVQFADQRSAAMKP